MADLTPPVALAAFAAAPMARESGLKIAVQAVRIALPAFIVPYLTVADPGPDAAAGRRAGGRRSTG